MDEHLPAIKTEKDTTPQLKVQAEARQSYLETVLSSPPQATSSAAPTFNPYTAYRGMYPTNNPTTLLGLDNATMDTIVPQTSNKSVLPTSLPSFHDYPAGAFCIDCNYCGKSIPNEHYHCSICDSGDFDLCQACVDRGLTCDGKEHWLIKRSIRGGMVIPSVTETIAPKKNVMKTEEEIKEPLETFEPYRDDAVAERTCNSCIRGTPSNLQGRPVLILPRTARA